MRESAGKKRQCACVCLKILKLFNLETSGNVLEPFKAQCSFRATQNILHGPHITFTCFSTDLEHKQRLYPYTILADWFFVIKVNNVFCAVRTELLYKTATFRL